MACVSCNANRRARSGCVRITEPRSASPGVVLLRAPDRQSRPLEPIAQALPIFSAADWILVQKPTRDVVIGWGRGAKPSGPDQRQEALRIGPGFIPVARMEVRGRGPGR